MIRWLLSLLLTAGLGVAPSVGTRPAVEVWYETAQGGSGVSVVIWADDRGRVRGGVPAMAAWGS